MRLSALGTGYDHGHSFNSVGKRRTQFRTPSSNECFQTPMAVSTSPIFASGKPHLFGRQAGSLQGSGCSFTTFQKFGCTLARTEPSLPITPCAGTRPNTECVLNGAAEVTEMHLPNEEEPQVELFTDHGEQKCLL